MCECVVGETAEGRLTVKTWMCPPFEMNLGSRDGKTSKRKVAKSEGGLVKAPRHAPCPKRQHKERKKLDLRSP